MNKKILVFSVLLASAPALAAEWGDFNQPWRLDDSISQSSECAKTLGFQTDDFLGLESLIIDQGFDKFSGSQIVLPLGEQIHGKEITRVFLNQEHLITVSILHKSIFGTKLREGYEFQIVMNDEVPVSLEMKQLDKRGKTHHTCSYQASGLEIAKMPTGCTITNLGKTLATCQFVTGASGEDQCNLLGVFSTDPFTTELGNSLDIEYRDVAVVRATPKGALNLGTMYKITGTSEYHLLPGDSVVSRPYRMSFMPRSNPTRPLSASVSPQPLSVSCN